MSTPSMRRIDLVNVGQIQAHTNLIKDIEFTLSYESIILSYLTVCVSFFHVNPNFNAKCEVNPVVHTIHFLVITLWPVVFARLFIYFKLRNVSYTKLKNALFYLDVYYYATFGLWTLYQIYLIVDLPRGPECSKPTGISLVQLNYRIIMICGAFPTLISVCALAFGCLVAPLLIWERYESQRAQME